MFEVLYKHGAHENGILLMAWRQEFNAFHGNLLDSMFDYIQLPWWQQNLK